MYNICISIIYVYRFLRGTGHLVEEETGHYVWSHKLLAGGGDWGGVGVGGQGVAGGLKVQIYLQGKKHLVCVLSPVVFIVVGVHTKK